MGKYAVIDLGTNTFNLLIVETKKNRFFAQVYKERYFVLLGEDGIETIGEKPYQRGIDAMKKFSLSLKEYDLDGIRAIGTAALRSATNGAQFVEEVKNSTGIQIELISGDTEAEYIYKGVKMAWNLRETPDMIMDIGGGSVEFVIANINGVLWQKSYPIGLSVLYRDFHLSEPITTSEQQQATAFIGQHLNDEFYDAIRKYKPEFLIGATGSFDVLVLLSKDRGDIEDHLSGDSFRYWKQKLLSLNNEERQALPDFPRGRSEMIVMALLLIDIAFDATRKDDMIVSPYAVKEGVLCEMMGYV